MSNQKQQKGHTPIPWAIGADGKTIMAGRGFGYVVACISGASTSGRRDKENSRFIVQAANAHDELLAAVKGALEAYNAMEPYLSTRAQLLDYASLNEGRASGFDIASVKMREVHVQLESAINTALAAHVTTTDGEGGG